MGILTRIFGSKEQRLQERMREKEAALSKDLDYLMKSMDREKEIFKRLKEIDKELNDILDKPYKDPKIFEKGSNVTLNAETTVRRMNELIAEGKKLIEELRSMRVLPKDEIDKLDDELFGIHDAANKLFSKPN